MPELTAVSEAAVAVLFENVAQCIQIEIDFADDQEPCDDGIDPTFWRNLVLAAIEDTDSKELGFMPTAAQPHPLADPECQMPAPACEVLDEWEWMLETLENYVLWDADYAMDDLFMDVDAKTSRRRRQKLGINDDYYTAIAPDPTDGELEKIRESLRIICQEP